MPTRFSTSGSIRRQNSGLVPLAVGLALAGCTEPATPTSEPAATAASISTTGGTLIPFETYELDNGLDVIFHRDSSDPVVAVNLAVHVGSGREETGRTGFAHLFEHLLFLDSENLGYGGLDAMNTRIGGEGTNGFTTTDITQYFQAVPADALEKVIWAEADKIGWFIQTVNADVLANEKQVVKNEKRQRVDNRPYGHNFSVVSETLYPEGHPYHHQVIGSLDDLDAATLDDVKAFYTRYYGPQNVTLTISGDFDPAQAKRLVERYFGEIPRGPDVPTQAAAPATLEADIDLLHEDAFATVPRLTLVWPTVGENHPDAPALQVLAQYLATGKKAPFNAVLVDELKVAPSVTAFPYSKALAGEFFLIVDANQGGDIDALVPAIDQAFARFRETGIPDADLDRIKTGLEADIYDNIQSALGKSIALGEANALYGDPGAFEARTERLRAVSPADVMRVYETYIAGRPRLSTSFVPQGAPDLGLEGARVAEVTEEAIVEGEGAAVEFDPAARVIDMPTPSRIDRTVEPAFGEGYDLPAPEIVRAEYDNGLEVYLLESDEVPLVRFSLRLDAGRVRNTPNAPAVAGLAADLLEKGTASRTTAELEDAIKDLGSKIDVSAGDGAALVTGTALARNAVPTFELVKEMLFQPRFDAEEFATLKRQRAEAITQAEGEPGAIARRELAALRYPEGSPLRASGLTGYGTREVLEAVTLDDIRAFHAANYTIGNAQLRVVGDVDAASLEAVWSDDALPSGEDRALVPVRFAPAGEAKVYVYDVPGAKQSVIQVFGPGLTFTDPRYALAEAANFQLGGIYTSDLMTELRVNKGYTYGVRSHFDAGRDDGAFGLSTSVRSNVTAESLALIRDILGSYGPDFTEDELAILKDARVRGQALGSETLDDKLEILGDISVYDVPADYRARNVEAVRAMSLDDFRSLASEFFDPDRMAYIVVGDAATQLDKIRELGLPTVELE